MRGVNFKVDGLSIDTLVVAGDSGRFVLDLALDVGEVVELSARDMMELRPLGPPGGMGRSEGIVYRLWGALVIGDVDELENQGSSSNNTASPRQKVSTDNVFEDGGFTS